MSLSSSAKRRPSESPRDKPQVDRAEHANLDRRPGAHLHPNARRAAASWPTGAPAAWGALPPDRAFAPRVGWK